MTKRQIDRLLMSAVAEALGVSIDNPRGARRGHAGKSTARRGQRARTLEHA